MEEFIQILVQFGGGKGGEPNNAAVRFLLPTFFWCILALISLREYRAAKNTRDRYLGTAAILGMARELLMFFAEYGGLRGFVPFGFIYNVYPPLEHAITMLSCSFIGYAFMNYHLGWEKFPRRFFLTSTTITVILYLVIALEWPGFLRLHPGISFASFWGDLAFRSVAIISMGIVLGAFVHAAGQGAKISMSLMCGFTFLFLDEFLMIFNIISSERYVDIFAPVRHNLHIWSIPFFLWMYWSALQGRMLSVQQELESLNAELEQRVAARTAELSNVNRELEMFNYSVSHDLRAPLLHIGGFTKILAEDCAGQLTVSGKECLHRLKNASRRVNVMIDALLDLSLTNSVGMQRRRLYLSRIAKGLAAEIALSDKDRSAEFRITPNMRAHGDLKLILRLMESLLENAWKYTRDCEAALIEFGSIATGQETVYFVKDNGVGFDMKHTDMLFTPFQRLHADKKFQGIGIGLATARKIICRHGGQIWAESSMGDGATFFFTLPPTPEEIQS